MEVEIEKVVEELGASLTPFSQVFIILQIDENEWNDKFQLAYDRGRYSTEHKLRQIKIKQALQGLKPAQDAVDKMVNELNMTNAG